MVITPNVTGDTKIAEETYYKIAQEQSKINFQALATLPIALQNPQITDIKALGNNKFSFSVIDQTNRYVGEMVVSGNEGTITTFKDVKTGKNTLLHHRKNPLKLSDRH